MKETDDALWIRCLNPEHEDKNPSMCVNKFDEGQYKKGYAYCFSCGYVMQFTREAVDKMAEKGTKKKELVKPVDWTELDCFFRDQISWKQLETLSCKWKVKQIDLIDYDIGSNGKCYTFPIYNGFEKLVGIQYRTLEGKKRCRKGSHLGLFIPVRKLNKVVVCEGFTDAVTATHLGYFGLGKVSSVTGEKDVEIFLKRADYQREVILCQDNDKAGERSTKKLQSVLRDWDVRVVVPETDLHQYYLDHGADKTKELLG